MHHDTYVYSETDSNTEKICMKKNIENKTLRTEKEKNNLNKLIKSSDQNRIRCF